MFGMEKEKKDTSFVYDLEKEYSNPEKRKEIAAKIMEKVSYIKKILRDGEDDELFAKIGVLLHGYVALKNVIEKISRKTN